MGSMGSIFHPFHPVKVGAVDRVGTFNPPARKVGINPMTKSEKIGDGCLPPVNLG